MTFRLIQKHFSALLREYGRLVNVYSSYGKLHWKFDIAIIKYPKVRCDLGGICMKPSLHIAKTPAYVSWETGNYLPVNNTVGRLKVNDPEFSFCRDVRGNSRQIFGSKIFQIPGIPTPRVSRKFLTENWNISRFCN